MAKDIPVVEAHEGSIRHTAKILGPSSAAAKAIEDLDARRANNEDAVIYQRGAFLLVGPRIVPDGPEDNPD